MDKKTCNRMDVKKLTVFLKSEIKRAGREWKKWLPEDRQANWYNGQNYAFAKILYRIESGKFDSK